MFKRIHFLFIRPLFIGLLCFSLIASAISFVLSKRPSESTSNSAFGPDVFEPETLMPQPDRAIVTDPTTNAITLEAIDRYPDSE